MLTLALALLAGLGPALAAAPALPGFSPAAAPAPPAYRGEAREVSNWEAETLRALHPLPLAAAAVILDAERPVVTRCVKLNNYWCVKSARWAGEIGTDEEGHVGFATAAHGARAAALLLRRYYVDLDRRTALAIVRRWAPAECRVAPSGPALPSLAVAGLGMTLRARWLAARQGGGRLRVAASDPVSPGALGPAARPGPAPAARPSARPVRRAATARARVSAVPLRPLPQFRVPDIAAGMGEKPIHRPGPSAAAAPRALPQSRPPAPRAGAPVRVAAGPGVTPGRAPGGQASRPLAPRAELPAVQPSPAQAAPLRALPAAGLAAAAQVTGSTVPLALPGPAAEQARPVVACASDEQRIRNYAARIVAGLGLGPEDDLRLFDPDGRPGPNLRAVMLAMSAVELGHLSADPGLVEEAVAALAPPATDSAPERPRTAPAPGEAAAGE